ncbi:MAG: hypothetical protein NC548_45975 [Lachnospiraceae bacterium]|nr:hypothetical protein [Lachnospiraceae bacterium]
MAKFELSISADYVAHWGIPEAIREFFQNALDEQTEDPSNVMFFDYDAQDQILRIGNQNSTLDAQTLLFGKTTKADNPKLIGHFGEGYKMATIVLLRNGKKVTFYNYNSREIWTTKLVKSKKYKGALVPTFYVEKVPIWESVPEASLIIQVEGISYQEFYEQIKPTNLNLYDEGVGELYSTSYGRILMDPRFKGKVFVSGLYVCSNDRLEYGYDFNPEQIQLDRDRRMVGDFDLSWTASRMWSEVERYTDNLMEVAGTFDGQYTADFLNSDQKYKLAKEFLKQNGDNAVPVSTQDELTRMASLGFNPVVVSQNLKKAITASPEWTENSRAKVKTLHERLKDFAQAINDRLTDEEREEINDIISRSRWALS